MVGAIGIGGAAAVFPTQHSHAANPLSALQSFSGGKGAASTSDGEEDGKTSTSISGLGQLLGSLQQLQTQNPQQFTQIVSQLANELKSAAQEASGGASQLLSTLANSFHQASAIGSLPQSPHRTTETQGYKSTGQPVSSSAVSGTAAGAGTNLQQLFAKLASQVNATLGS
jgi:hypothetical protein